MFRFTVREMLLTTVVVALALGWWLDRSQLAHQRDFNEFFGDRVWHEYRELKRESAADGARQNARIAQLEQFFASQHTADGRLWND
jgi:hypothetical protein